MLIGHRVWIRDSRKPVQCPDQDAHRRMAPSQMLQSEVCDPREGEVKAGSDPAVYAFHVKIRKMHFNC